MFPMTRRYFGIPWLNILHRTSSPAIAKFGLGWEMLYSEWRREFQGWMKLYEPIYSNILQRQQCLLLCPFVFGRDVTLGAYSQLFIPYFIPSVLHIPPRVLSH